jgi:predicted Zn-dependent protease
MARSSKIGLVRALRDLTRNFSAHMANLPAVLQDFFWNAVLPVALGLAVLAVLGSIVRKVKRIVYPPNSMELHKEALNILQSAGYKKQNKWAERQAIILLQKAVEQDPRYEPATWSLAALYLYRLNDPKSAIPLLSSSSSSSQSQSILLDAKAMADGQHQMIQAELRQTEFLSISCVDPSFYTTVHQSPGIHKKSDNKGTDLQKKQQ